MPEGGVVETRWGPWWVRLRALLEVLLAAGLIAFFFFVARRVYQFSDPASRAVVAGDRPYYIDVLTRLPTHAHLVVLGLGFALSLAGPGAWLLSPLRIQWRGEVERLLFGVMAGMAAVTFITLGLGEAQLIHPPPLLGVWVVCAAISAIDLLMRVRRWGRDAAALLTELRASGWRVLGTVALAIGLLAAFYLALLGALSPEVQFDATWYHLGVPAHYAEHGGLYDIVRETRVTGAGFQPYQDMLYTFLIPLVGIIGAKVLHWVDAVLAVAAIIYFCRAWFCSLQAGLLAGLIFITLPVVVWSVSTGSNDLPQAFLTILCLHAFLRWRQTQSWRWLALAAMSAGFAVGFKLTSGVILVPFLLAVGFATWVRDGRRRPLELLGRGLARVAGAGAIAAAICIPWLFRSYQLTSDPVFPELTGIFKSPYWNPQVTAYLNSAYSGYGHQPTLLSLLRLPWDTAVHPFQYRSIIGPVFLVMAPLMVWAAVTLGGRMRRQFLFLGAFALVAIVIWYASNAVVIWYAYGAVSIVCIVVAVSVLAPVRAWSGWLLRGSAVGLLLVMLVLNSQFLVPYQPDSIKPSISGRAAIDFPYLYSHAPPPPPWAAGPMLQYLNGHLSKRDKVYVTTTLMVDYLYAKPELYNGFFYDSPAFLGQWTLESPDAYEQLRAVGVDYVLVYTQNVPQLMQSPLGQKLRPVATVGGQVLFRVVT